LGLALERVHVERWVADAEGVVEDKGDFLEVGDAGVDGVAGGLGVELLGREMELVVGNEKLRGVWAGWRGERTLKQ